MKATNASRVLLDLSYRTLISSFKGEGTCKWSGVLLQTWGFASILFTPSTKCERNFARSALLKRDLLTEAIWTRHDNTCTQQHNSQVRSRGFTQYFRLCLTRMWSPTALTNGERDGGMEWYKLKKSCSVEESRKAARKEENRRVTGFTRSQRLTQLNSWLLMNTKQTAGFDRELCRSYLISMKWGSVRCKGHPTTRLWKFLWSRSWGNCSWAWAAASADRAEIHRSGLGSSLKPGTNTAQHTQIQTLR